MTRFRFLPSAGHFVMSVAGALVTHQQWRIPLCEWFGGHECAKHMKYLYGVRG